MTPRLFIIFHVQGANAREPLLLSATAGSSTQKVPPPSALGDAQEHNVVIAVCLPALLRMSSRNNTIAELLAFHRTTSTLIQNS